MFQEKGDVTPRVVTDDLELWVFGLHPSSGILKTRKHNVSETQKLV
jgi:hypothetical protein